MCMSMASMEKKSSRKRAAQVEPRSSKRHRMQASMASPNDLISILKDYQEKAPDTSADSSSTSVWMALNVVLDHTTFGNSLLQHDFSKKQNNNIVPLVPRKYEESYMRECSFDEDKPCSLGQHCECKFHRQ